MKIPSNMSEEEVVAIIRKVSRGLANKFRFGYHDRDDIEQQASLIAWEGLADYDGVRKLENFLWTHVKNRLCNYKRDNYERLNSPCEKCQTCPHKTIIDANYTHSIINVEDCSKYMRWLSRNSAKKNLMQTIFYDNVQDEHEDNMKDHTLAEDIVSYNELETLLDKFIPVELRHEYLRLKNGLRIYTSSKEEICQIVRDIVETKYVLLSENREGASA